MICREVSHGSQAYQQTLALRDEILRKPLGLIFSPETMSTESTDFHLACYDEKGHLLGCLVLTKTGEETVRMRQVAVQSDLQRTGVGTVLVRYSEMFALQQGFTQMTLHARDTAIPFYLRLGYELYGEPFEEVTIPHHKMRKALAES